MFMGLLSLALQHVAQGLDRQRHQTNAHWATVPNRRGCDADRYSESTKGHPFLKFITNP